MLPDTGKLCLDSNPELVHSKTENDRTQEHTQLVGLKILYAALQILDFLGEPG